MKPISPFEERLINRVAIGCVVILLAVAATGVSDVVRKELDKTKSRERLAADVEKCVNSDRYSWRRRYKLDDFVGIYWDGYVSPEAQCIWEFSRGKKS